MVRFPRILPRRVLLILAAIALATVGAGVALAAVPSGDGTINGCYTKVGGVLRVVDAGKGQRCTSLEIPISWSQQGPAGPAGPSGPQGPSGTSQLRLEYADVAVPAHGRAGVSHRCQDGARAFSAGFRIDTGMTVIESRPDAAADLSPVGWTLSFENVTDTDKAAIVYVVCGS